jgi:hypothetical protein
MKTVIVILLSVIAIPLFAGNSTNDVVAIQAATASREIRTTRTGYSVTTASGTRTAYKTPTGYYVEGGPGVANQQIIRTSTGYRVESSATRGAAFGSRRH